MSVGLEADRSAVRKFVEEPEAVIRPETSEFDHRRSSVGRKSLGQPFQNCGECDFFLGFVNAPKTADDFTCERPVVAAVFYQDPVVHHLDAPALVIDDFARIRNTGKVIGVGA